MRSLIVCLFCSFLVTVITTQDCAPCECSWNFLEQQLYATCSPWIKGWDNLTEIPDTINRSVNHLDVNEQAFTILKNNTFASFHNLTVISIQYSNIDIIEKQAFKNLTELSELRLRNNNIQSLPDGMFQDLRKITRIDLSHNSIAELPKNIFSNLSTLVKLWLIGNKIKALPVGLFLGLRQIEEIDLYDNKITKLEKYLFSNLPHLRTVDIGANYINTIEDESFSKLPDLKGVNLRKNEFKEIGLNIIDNVQQLKYFALSANPWHCDEDLCAVMDSVASYIFDTSTCRTPAEVKGTRWKRLLDTFIPDILNYTRNVEEGDTVYLECKYCFASKILWKFNNKRISRDHSVDISKTSLTSTLILSNVTQDDSGHYSCHVRNCATCKIAGAYLNVNYKKPDDKKYTVTDLVPTTSLVTQSTTVEDPADTSTQFNVLSRETSLSSRNGTSRER